MVAKLHPSPKLITTCTILVALAGPALALVTPKEKTPLSELAFRHSDLTIEKSYQTLAQLPAAEADRARQDLAVLGIGSDGAFLDSRSGRWETLLPAQPLLPGDGVGNSMRWRDLGLAAPSDTGSLEEVAWDAFVAYLRAFSGELRIDLAEVPAEGRVVAHGGELIQIYAPRVVGGLPVRDSSLTAVINRGNLVLFGAQNWADVDVRTQPSLSTADASAIVRTFLGDHGLGATWGKSELVLVPMARGHNPAGVASGRGYAYRLAWVIRPRFEDDLGTWEALVDAHGGEILSFEDQNHYAEAKGGVYPKTNDGVGADGTEQPGWPMPWMDVGSATTDTGGNYNLTGSQTASFFGPFVNMADNCGTDSLTQSGGIDWGSSGGTDCTTPGFGGAGNTHSSRSGFYELNRIKEMARSHLPSNSWLQGRLTANMNINNTCNAFWNGSTVNFYRSGGGCANTGEIAAVFDHEWGHGMDANDVVGGIASPSGEGIADIYSALRLYDSCIGRNFLSTPCSGNGDPCLTCTGVRDIDYLQRQSGNPHDYSWSNANCGGSVHCVGGVYSEAVWSLWKRKLPTLYGMDNNTAAEVTTRLTYIAAGNTSTWFSGGPPNGGCSGSSGYMNYLAADDDNGNLNDGTPHMTAIYQAFNDQEIACQTPTVQDSGCAGAPTSAPNVTATSADTSIGLSWGAVTGAGSYEVFRGEGIFQCDFGKVKIGSTTGTSFTDTGLQNGRDYSYVVIPKGSPASCFGPASACDTVQPGALPCTVDADCDDGTFCNGAEACVANVCTAGSDPCAANPTWTCDEVGDVCVPECNVDSDCDDGAFCNGVESCNAGTCAAGSDPCPGQSCDEAADICTDTNGPQIAVYDAGLGAPACAIRGSSCDSTTLVDSRDTLSPAEPNQPNTLDACADGTSGTYHSDESNDRIVVSTLDAQDFSEGATVQIDATVWAWSTGSSDTLDLYYAADANSPSWTYITSIVPPSGGAHTLSAQYTLPAGTLQAVRAVFRYLGSASSCSGGAYDDADDLVFAVGGGVPPCVVDADCDDGAFCNGAETCNAGTCAAGTAIDCNDSVSCTDDSCNETTDTCDNVTNDANCDNAAFCDGAETCDAVNDCQPGTAPNCSDGVGCTDDSCNETTDACDNVTNDANCDNAAFCDGAETCDAVNDCQPGTAPNCDDGVGCTDDSCNETTDSCDNLANDANCADPDFCNGAETCDALNDCQPGSDPCPGQSCDEGADVCVACIVDADCDDGAFCNGAESCNAGVCQAGTSPTVDDGVACTDDSCDEVNDVVVHSPNDGFCDNGQFCDGAETCDAVNDCQPGTPPTVNDGVGCTDDSCDEVNDVIANIPNDANCDNGLFCDGSETCDAINDCQAGTDPCAPLACDEAGDICVGGSNPTLWMSFRNNTAVPGVGTVRDEDIVSYDEVTGTWALEFDGSDVGLGSLEISGLAVLPGGDLLLSFTAAGTVGGLAVDDSDIVRFTGTGGPNTSGTFSVYFDGSDVALTSNSEDVDGIALAADGRLIVSTTGGFSGTGASGADEDLFLFTGTLGSSTSGSFVRHFDGSDVGLGGNSAEDVDAAALTAGGNLLFSTIGNFSVAGLSGADEDVVEFAGTFGNATSGTFSMRQDLTTLGIISNEDIGSLHIFE